MWRSQTEENTGPRGPQQVFNLIFWEILWLLHTTPLWAKPNTQDWNKLIKAPCNRNYHRLNSTGYQGNKGNINLNVDLFQISSKWVEAGTWSYSAQSRTGPGQWRQRATLNTRLICCVPWAWEQNNHHIFFLSNIEIGCLLWNRQIRQDGKRGKFLLTHLQMAVILWWWGTSLSQAHDWHHRNTSF